MRKENCTLPARSMSRLSQISDTLRVMPTPVPELCILIKATIFGIRNDLSLKLNSEPSRIKLVGSALQIPFHDQPG